MLSKPILIVAAIAVGAVAIAAFHRQLWDIAFDQQSTEILSGDPSSPGVLPASPAQLEPDIVPVKMGDKYYAIPANTLGSPPEGGRENEFYVSDGLLLVFFWPSMGGRASGNSNNMPSANGQSGIRVLTFFFFDDEPADVLRRKFIAHVLEPVPSAIECSNVLVPAQCPYLHSTNEGRFARLSDKDGLIHFERYDRPSHDEMFKSDIYVETREGQMVAFFVCNRPTAMRRGHGCTMRFTYKLNWYDVSFDVRRIALTESALLRTKVEQTIDEFERGGQLLMKNSGKGSNDGP